MRGSLAHADYTKLYIHTVGDTNSPAYTPYPVDVPSSLDEFIVHGSHTFIRAPADGTIVAKYINIGTNTKIWGETNVHIKAEELYSNGRVDAEHGVTFEVVDATFDAAHDTNATEFVRIVGPGLVDDISGVATRAAMHACPAIADPLLLHPTVTVTGTTQPNGRTPWDVFSDWSSNVYFHTSATVGAFIQFAYPRPVTIGNLVVYMTSSHRSYNNGAEVQYYDEVTSAWVALRTLNTSTLRYSVWEDFRFTPATAKVWRIKHIHATTAKRLGFQEIHPSCDRSSIDIRSGVNMTCLAFDCQLEISAPHALVIETGLLAASTITLDVNTLIAANSITTKGRGYPSATGPGAGPPSTPGLGDTSIVSGTGGAHGGNGGMTYHNVDASNPRTMGGTSYGSASNPRHFGSGGGRGFAYNQPGNVVGQGGTGGGTIIITARQDLVVWLTEAISSSGDMTASCTGCGGGAGGSVLLRADRAFVHSDRGVQANGACGTYAGCGGGGRVAVYTQHLEGIVSVSTGFSSYSYPTASGKYGGAGTIYTSVAGNTTLLIDSRNYDQEVAGVSPERLSLTPYPADLTSSVGSIVVRREAQLYLPPTATLITEHLLIDPASFLIGDNVQLNVFKFTNRGFIVGDQSVMITDSRFRGMASSLTKAGACYGGDMNSRWTLTTSDPNAPADLADKLRDPVLAGRLLTNPAGTPRGWFQFEFPAAVLLTTVRLKYSSAQYLYRHSVQISDDGTTWRTHFNLFSSMDGTRLNLVEFPPAAAKYWRIYASNPSYTQVGLDYIDWGCAGPIVHFDTGSTTTCDGHLCSIDVDIGSQFAEIDITGKM